MERAWLPCLEDTENVIESRLGWFHFTHKRAKGRTEEKEKERYRMEKYVVKVSETVYSQIYQSMNLVDWIYNKCVERYYQQPITEQQLIEQFVEERGLRQLPISPDFQANLLHLPRETRYQVVKTFLQAEEKWFRCRKERTARSYRLDYAAGIWPSEDLNFITRCPIISKGDECQLVLQPNGELSLEVQIDTWKDDRAEIISLDPGVRTFQTAYDPQGQLYQFGTKQDYHKMLQMAQTVNNLHTGYKRYYLDPMDTSLGSWKPQPGWPIVIRQLPTGRGTPSMLNKAKRIQDLIISMISELHEQTATFLCQNYQTIIIPQVNPAVMAIWDHPRFLQLLLRTAQLHQTRIIIGTEEYTSKTCGSCNYVHRNLGASKQYHCPQCGYHTERDSNGAYNILRLNANRV